MADNKKEVNPSQYIGHDFSAKEGAFRKLKKGISFPGKKVGLILVVALVAVASFYGATRFFNKNKSSSGQVKIKGVKSLSEINQNFSFPLTDSNGEQVSEIEFVVESAEKRDEIVVKGQKVSTIKGRVFLIVNLKIKNNYKQAIEVDARDYIRLSKNKTEGEFLAPEIHNDPVEVQALSTKITRVGFVLDDKDKDLEITFGEIGGNKEKINLDL